MDAHLAAEAATPPLFCGAGMTSETLVRGKVVRYEGVCGGVVEELPRDERAERSDAAEPGSTRNRVALAVPSGARVAPAWERDL